MRVSGLSIPSGFLYGPSAALNHPGIMSPKRLKDVIKNCLGFPIGMIRESLPDRRQDTLQTCPVLRIQTSRQLSCKAYLYVFWDKVAADTNKPIWIKLGCLRQRIGAIQIPGSAEVSDKLLAELTPRANRSPVQVAGFTRLPRFAV